MDFIKEKFNDLEKRIKHFEWLEEKNNYKKEEIESFLAGIIFFGTFIFIGFILGIFIMLP